MRVILNVEECRESLVGRWDDGSSDNGWIKWLLDVDVDGGRYGRENDCCYEGSLM